MIAPARVRSFSAAAAFSRTGNLIIGFGISAALFFFVAVYIALVALPAGAHQSEAYRVAFVHMPAGWLSLLIYVLLAASASAHLFAGIRWCALAPIALAPTGAMFILTALCSGSLLERPTAGLWWAWDARFVAELILLGLYLALMALYGAGEDRGRGHRLAGWLAVTGVGVLPLVYFSGSFSAVHQAAFSGVAHPLAAITAGMAAMTLAGLAYAAAAVLLRLQCLMLEEERSPEARRTEGVR